MAHRTSMWLQVSIVAAAVVTSGCAATLRESVAQGLAAMGTPVLTSAATADEKLMIFGGRDHSTYLGCISCPQYDSDSVYNQSGLHGNRYEPDSVFNPRGIFGARYSNYSPCNPVAKEPPVIVDREGNFYGRLTVNPHHAQATPSDTWKGWIAGVCADR